MTSSLSRWDRVKRLLAFVLVMATMLVVVVVLAAVAASWLRDQYYRTITSPREATERATTSVLVTSGGPLGTPQHWFQCQITRMDPLAWQESTRIALGRFHDSREWGVVIEDWQRDWHFDSAGEFIGDAAHSRDAPRAFGPTMSRMLTIARVHAIDGIASAGWADVRMTTGYGVTAWSVLQFPGNDQSPASVVHPVDMPNEDQRLVSMGAGTGLVLVIGAASGREDARFARPPQARGTVIPAAFGRGPRIAMLSEQGTRLSLYTLEGEGKAEAEYLLEAPEVPIATIRAFYQPDGGILLLVYPEGRALDFHYYLPESPAKAPHVWSTPDRYGPERDPHDNTLLASLHADAGLSHFLGHDAEELPVLRLGDHGYLSFLNNWMAVMYSPEGRPLQTISATSTMRTQVWFGTPAYDEREDALLLPVGVHNPSGVSVLRLPLGD